MHYLIVESHPFSGSFNAGAAARICETLQTGEHTVSRINLVEEKFDPVMGQEDLRLWKEGKYSDEMVKKYQSEIDNADILVFPFPIWWGAMPAVLKGFCDKVFLPGWAYRYTENNEMVGNLNSKKAVVITTMETPAQVFEDFFNNPVEGAFIKDTLEKCGVEVIKYFQIEKIVSGGRENAENKMNEIVDFFRA